MTTEMNKWGKFQDLLASRPAGTDMTENLTVEKTVSQGATHKFRVVLKSDWARALTDKDLIDLCDGGPFHFGGHVDRWGDIVHVSVYVD